MRVRQALISVTFLLAVASSASAQTVGTFRWQQRPYCNVLTLTVVQDGGVYHLDGWDDQCGAAQRAAVSGQAFLNPDGTIGLGLTIVTTPGGLPVHLEAALTVATVSGRWRDSTFDTGTFAFTPGAAVPGPARPSIASQAPFAPATAGGLSGAATPAPFGCVILGPAADSTVHLALQVPVGAVLSGVRLRTVDSASQRMFIDVTKAQFTETGVVNQGALVSFTSTAGTTLPTRSFPPSLTTAATAYSIVVSAPAHTGALLFCGVQPIYTTP